MALFTLLHIPDIQASSATTFYISHYCCFSEYSVLHYLLFCLGVKLDLSLSGRKTD